MSTQLSSAMIDRIRQRRAMLWVCGRYERLPGTNLHEPIGSVSDEIQLYRSTPSDLDNRIAGLYWEAIWLDSPVGVLIDAIESRTVIAPDHPSPRARRPVKLATDPDEEGKLDTRELLPVYCLAGLFDHPQSDGRFGAHPAIKRRMFRLNLQRKIRDYPNRVLVVLGAENQDDVKELFEILDSFAPLNFHVLLVWPQNGPNIDWDRQGVVFEIWRGNTDDFLRELESQDVLQVGGGGPVNLRINQRLVSFEESELFGISESFRLITADDLTDPIPEEITASEFESFIRGDEQNWSGYAAGFAFDRKYHANVETQLGLQNYLLGRLQVESPSRKVQNETVSIPAQNGSGITTLLRLTAFKIAQQGIPVLVLRNDEVGINVDALAAFLNRLSIKTEKQQSAQAVVSTLIVFDTDHQHIPEIASLAQKLGSQGRHVLVLRAETARADAIDPIEDRIGLTATRIQGRHVKLPVLRSTVTGAELDEIARHFHNVVAKFQLGLELPDIEDWRVFQDKQGFFSVEGPVESDSLFWVALHFFLFIRSEPPQNFGRWFTRVYADTPRSDIREAVVRIAALSSYRLVTPLTPLLRSISGGSLIDLELVSALARFDEKSGLVIWDSRPTSLHDQVVRFRHPTLAQMFLRYNQLLSANSQVQLILPIIRNLKAGGSSDLWLIESLAYQVLRTEKTSTLEHIEMSLETFREIPPQISEYNKVVLHHWARALYHHSIVILRSRDSDRASQQNELDGIDRLSHATRKLEAALELPSRPGRDENPSHLHNTLGSIYFELYLRLLQAKREDADAAWEQAAKSFERSLALQADNFAALCAYGFRLIQVAKKQSDPAQLVERALLALSYFDEAEDVVEQYELEVEEVNFLRVQKLKAWEMIDDQQAQRYLTHLLNSGEEAGYLISARRALRTSTVATRSDDEQHIMDDAIAILEVAVTNPAKSLSWQTPYLLYSLYRKHPVKRVLFDKCLELLRMLEQTKFNWHVRMLFDYAVLCYQNRLYDEGQKRFQDLRRRLRQPEQPNKRFQDYLRARGNPTLPHVIAIEVRRIDTEWRGYGYVQEFGHEILMRPRHFEVPPKTGEYRSCIVRFETMGPIAVPENFPTTAEWSN